MRRPHDALTHARLPVANKQQGAWWLRLLVDAPPSRSPSGILQRINGNSSSQHARHHVINL